MEFDEAALICDLAETYHIYDYRSLPAKLVATLSAGLRENSRIKMRMAGAPASQETILLATIADRIELFRYGFSDQKKDPPPLLVDILYGTAKQGADGVMSFDSVSDFEQTLARIKGE